MSLFVRRASVGLGLLSLASLATLACNETAAEAAPSGLDTPTSQKAPAIAPASGAAAAVPVQGQASYDEAAFKLKLNGPETGKVGQALRLEVVLEAVGGFKVNDEYPIKFKFASTSGVKPTKEIVRKDEAELKKTRATIPLSVTLTESGKRQVAGKLSFSVCTDERCLIEKRDLLVHIDAT